MDCDTYYNAEAEHPLNTCKHMTHVKDQANTEAEHPTKKKHKHTMNVQDEANVLDSLSNTHLLKDRNRLSGEVSPGQGKGRNAMRTGNGKKSGRASKKGKRNVQPLLSTVNVQ